MKAILKVSLLGLLLGATLTGAVVDRGRVYPTPMSAAQAHPGVKQQLSRFLELGFDLYSAYPKPAHEGREPEGNFQWGSAVFQLRDRSGNYTEGSTFVTLSVNLEYQEQADGFRARDLDIQEYQIR